MLSKLFNDLRFYLILFGPLKGRWIYMAPRHGIKKILGVYEPLIAKLIAAQIKPGDVCMDVGSHIGYFSLLMAVQSQTGLVIAIDPIKSNIVAVKKSFKKNKLLNIKAYDYGLSNVEGRNVAEVYTDSDMVHFTDSVQVSAAPSHTSSSFRVKSLDELVKESNLDNLNFIKIDVEGYEEKVLLGGMTTLKKWKPTLIIEIHAHELGKRIYHLLRKLGYTIYNIHKEHIKADDIKNLNLQYFLLAIYES